LVRRSRRSLLVLGIASLLWFGFVREGCICSVGATQNVSQSLFDSGYVIPLGALAFFVLPLLFTLFFGRTFCASVCPLGALQEVVAVRSWRVPRWLDHALGVLPFIYLGAVVLFAASGTAYLICRYDPFVLFFRQAGNAHMWVVAGCVMLVSLFIGRPYCRYLCPYGAVLGWLSRISKWHLRIVPGECITCRLCENACPYGAIREPTVAPSPQERARGRRYLGWLLLSLPLLIGLPAWLGTAWSAPLSRLDPTVRLAEQVRLEETDQTSETTNASDAFRNTGQPAAELYEEAVLLQQRYAYLGGFLGAWIGVVLAAKLIQLSVRRRRDGYTPDRADCVSCGRCFKSCPVELVRLGVISDVSEMVEENPA
jgi:polyferredoxin